MALGLSIAPNKDIDISQLYAGLKERHRNVYLYQSSDHELFIYRTIGRKEYYDLIKDESFSIMEKEDVICKGCVLWPDDYDFDSCSAGLPSALCKVIIENSLLDNMESQKNCLQYYRSEMYTLDNVITCMINEAFPTIDIEEIEEWDIEKTMKYYSRAEWKLANVRGLPIHDITKDMTEEVRTEEISDTEVKKRKRKLSKIQDPIENNIPTEATPEKIKKRKRRKNTLTPDQLAELMNQASIPGEMKSINWDDAKNTASELDTVDTTPAGLRNRFA